MMASVTKAKQKGTGDREQGTDAERFPPCKSCGKLIDAAPRWTTYGGSGLCEECDPHAPEARQPPANGNGNGRGLLRRTMPGYGDPSAWREAHQSKVESPKSEADPETSDLGPETFLAAPIEQIEPDPDQPRKTFDQTELDQLAASLKADGQIVPIIVNVLHGDDSAAPRYRIIEGERRWRAAKIAELKTLNVVVRDLDQATVVRLQGLANLERSDLNAIEEAEWCRRMTSPIAEGGGGMTQQSLADRLGVTQAEISNRIRVLRAPDWARELVICGQMSRKHALCLLEYEGAAKVLAEARTWTSQQLKDEEIGTSTEYADYLRQAARQATYRVEDSGSVDVGNYKYRTVKWSIELTDDVREKLDLVEVEDYRGQKELRAQNVKLAKKLLDEAEKSAKAAAAKKGDKREAKQAKKEQALSPAEQKQLDARKAEQFKRRLKDWYHDWLRVLCAQACAQPVGGFDGAGWLAVWSLFARADDQYSARETLGKSLSKVQGQGPKSKVGRGSGSAEIAKALTGVDAAGLKQVVAEYGLSLLVHDDGAPRGVTGGQNPVVYDEVVETLAGLLNLDIQAAWRDDRASPMRQRYWEIHGKDQLIALGKELGVALLESQKKSQMVAILWQQQRPLPMPKELQALTRRREDAKKGRSR
jgi:ParB/RepB/Spo0J family partition protein